MKCGPGKCGDDMNKEKTTKPEKQKIQADKGGMKCGPGKCGDDMNKEKTAKPKK